MPADIACSMIFMELHRQPMASCISRLPCGPHLGLHRKRMAGFGVRRQHDVLQDRRLPFRVSRVHGEVDDPNMP